MIRAFFRAVVFCALLPVFWVLANIYAMGWRTILAMVEKSDGDVREAPLSVTIEVAEESALDEQIDWIARMEIEVTDETTAHLEIIRELFRMRESSIRSLGRHLGFLGKRFPDLAAMVDATPKVSYAFTDEFAYATFYMRYA